MGVVTVLLLLVAVPPICGQVVSRPSIVDGNLQFDLNLYRLIRRPSNFVYSPFSIHSALSMLLLGAGGANAEELAQVLGLQTGNLAHAAYRLLLSDLNQQSFVGLKIANGLFINPSFSLNSQFQSAVNHFYSAKTEAFDFDAPGGAHVPINDWVEEKTNNMITDLLSSSDVTQQTKLILINTVFFNGTWSRPFDERNTHQETFFLSEGDRVQVDMMQQETFLDYRQTYLGEDQVQIVRVPFTGRRFSMYIILPNQIDGVERVEDVLYATGSDQSIDYIFNDLEWRNINLHLPKFTIETDLDLTKNLQAVGIEQAFRGGDFLGISSSPLSLTSVIQKAKIEVKETGTVAAAATAVIVGFSLPPPSINVNANHPFLFYLRDDTSGLVLFHGKVLQP